MWKVRWDRSHSWTAETCETETQKRNFVPPYGYLHQLAGAMVFHYSQKGWSLHWLLDFTKSFLLRYNGGVKISQMTQGWMTEHEAECWPASTVSWAWPLINFWSHVNIWLALSKIFLSFFTHTHICYKCMCVREQCACMSAVEFLMTKLKRKVTDLAWEKEEAQGVLARWRLTKK